MSGTSATRARAALGTGTGSETPRPPATSERDTFTERVRNLFLAHPGQWLDGLAIASIAGQYAWRSRVSDARRAFRMTIENRVRTVRHEDGRVTKKSEYRYVPAPAPRPVVRDTSGYVEMRLF